MGFSCAEAERRVLPTGDALLTAMRGHHVGAHPLSRSAFEFGVLYATYPAGPGCVCRCGRAELVREVDVWAAAFLPRPHPAARIHAEPLGTIIDRLARHHVRAFGLLMTVAPSAPQVHAAWHRLAELVDGYNDLNTGLTQRSLRLPELGEIR